MPSCLVNVTSQRRSGKTIAVAAPASNAAITELNKGLRGPEASAGLGIHLKGSDGHINRNGGGAR